MSRREASFLPKSVKSVYRKRPTVPPNSETVIGRHMGDIPTYKGYAGRYIPGRDTHLGTQGGIYTGYTYQGTQGAYNRIYPPREAKETH